MTTQNERECTSRFISEALAALGRQFGGSRETQVAVIQVCCDESGKLADSRFVVLAAAVAEDFVWQTLHGKWTAILREAGLSYVHMVEAMNYDKTFRPWKQRGADRDGVLESLAILANQHIAYNYSFEMDAARFRTLPQADQQRLKNLPYCGFEGLMRAISHNHQQHPDMRFHLVYDLSEEYSARA